MQAIPALSPRQLQLLQGRGHEPSLAAGFVCNTTVVESTLTDPAAGGLRAMPGDKAYADAWVESAEA